MKGRRCSRNACTRPATATLTYVYADSTAIVGPLAVHSEPHDYDLCAGHGVPVWCGGMLETGLGRAANVALASLPNFTLPGDTSASDRYWATDITEPFVLEEGRIRVPTGPGLGREPIPEILRSVTTSQETVRSG